MTAQATAPILASPDYLVHQLKWSREFFDRATAVFTDEHGGFAPEDGMMTVTQQIGHVADTLDWFHDALLDMEGFDTDFEKRMGPVMSLPSLTEARAWWQRSHDRLLAFIEGSTTESLSVCLPENDPMIAGASRAALIGAVVEHTAHHRGSLSVYARVAGLVPPMPYGEMA